MFAGMVPVYLKHHYQAHGVFKDAKTVFAIHNLAYQGTSVASDFALFKLPSSAYNVMEWIYKEPDGRKTPVRPAHIASSINLEVASCWDR